MNGARGDWTEQIPCSRIWLERRTTTQRASRSRCLRSGGAEDRLRAQNLEISGCKGAAVWGWLRGTWGYMKATSVSSYYWPVSYVSRRTTLSLLTSRIHPGAEQQGRRATGPCLAFLCPTPIVSVPLLRTSALVDAAGRGLGGDRYLEMWAQAAPGAGTTRYRRRSAPFLFPLRCCL